MQEAINSIIGLKRRLMLQSNIKLNYDQMLSMYLFSINVLLPSDRSQSFRKTVTEQESTFSCQFGENW